MLMSEEKEAMLALDNEEFFTLSLPMYSISAQARL